MVARRAGTNDASRQIATSRPATSGIRDRIEGADAQQESLEELCQPRREHDPDTDSDQRKASALHQHIANDVRGARAERHAHANLLRPLADVIRDHPVEANRCQEQAHGPEQASHERGQSEREEGVPVVEMLGHRPHVVDRYLTISLCKGLSNRGRQCDG